jgi:hypothetical protein
VGRRSGLRAAVKPPTLPPERVMDEHAFCRARAMIDIDAARRHLSETLGQVLKITDETVLDAAAGVIANTTIETPKRDAA